MDYKIYVRIGDKYAFTMNTLLNKSWDQSHGYVKRISGYIFSGIRLYEPFPYQKTLPVVLIDIDLEFINDYTSLFLQPVQRGEFLVTRNWWWQDNHPRTYKFLGGFYKFSRRYEIFTKLLDKIRILVNLLH